MTAIVETFQLSKSFGGRDVVSNVHMSIKRGEIYGFLGQNGAGKTTIMKMMLNLVRPTHGEIRLLGERLTPNSTKLLASVGSVIEYPVLYGHLTAYETLKLHCEYMGFKRGTSETAIKDSLELVGLHTAEKKPVHMFSLGMKQRLGLARAIVTKPELLVLDEPTNGLDPVAIREMRSIFKTLQTELNMTLLISSHILGEVELIADTVGIIRGGKLIEQVSMEKLQALNTGSIMLATNDSRKAAAILDQSLGITQYELVNDKQLQIMDSSIPVHKINKTLVNQDIEISGIHRQAYSLEQYFMERMLGVETHA